MFAHVSAIVLAACVLLPNPLCAGVRAVVRSEQAPGAAAGLSESDRSAIRAAHDSARHAVHATTGGHEARNPGQRWQLRFDGRGSLVRPDSNAWTWGLELESYGFAGSERELTSAADVRSEEATVTYRWDESLDEWYINEARGVEHGFTVHDRPKRIGILGRSGFPGPRELERELPLTFTLAVRGGLRADVLRGGRGVRFVGESGRSVLTYSGLIVFDADGRELEAGFESDGSRLILAIDERGARYPLTIDPIVQEAYLKASNSEAADFFGRAVAVSGDTLVVGAPNEDSGAVGVDGDENDSTGFSSGAAYVFVRSAGSWAQQAYLKASNTDAFDSFGESLAISGDTLVIGAPGEESGVSGDQNDNSVDLAGAAYVFVRNGTSWSQQAYLKAPDSDELDVFARSVGISGDTIVVGVPGDDSDATGIDGDWTNDDASASGAAYVFVRSGSSWSQQAYLKASNTDARDVFGNAVSISSDTIVVGAWKEESAATGVDGDEADNSFEGAGAVYVFVRNGTSWTQEAYLKASNTEGADQFGFSVAVAGDTTVVGATAEDGGSTGVNGNQGNSVLFSSGAAYVFTRTGTAWSQQAYLKASNTDAADLFGCSVALDGERALVGARWEDSPSTGVDGGQNSDAGGGSGAAYLFMRSGTSWAQAGYLKASNTGPGDQFGYTLALSADLAVIGAPEEDSAAAGVNGDQDDDSASDSGAAYVFDLDPTLVGTTYCPGIPNSTGLPAQIGASGSAVASENFLWLAADSLPPNRLGYFLVSMSQGFIAGPGGSQGNLCLGQPFGRYNGSAQWSGSNGVMGLTVDLAAIPQLGAAMAGDTFNFQCWYRDVNPTSTSNFSDAVSVAFQ